MSKQLLYSLVKSYIFSSDFFSFSSSQADYSLPYADALMERKCNTLFLMMLFLKHKLHLISTKILGREKLTVCVEQRSLKRCFIFSVLIFSPKEFKQNKTKSLHNFFSRSCRSSTTIIFMKSWSVASPQTDCSLFHRQ